MLKTTKEIRHRILGGLWGALIGDALGVPVEFTSRHERKRYPVSDMTGYGTFNLPPGSFSDDSSLLLCTVEALIDGFNLNHISGLFIRWLKDARWTPHGETFDVGRTTYHAIMRLINNVEPGLAGLDKEKDNGNGSLMRILPVSIYCLNQPVEKMMEYTHMASSITHRHPRSLVACGFYSLMVSSLIRGLTPYEAYKDAVDKTINYYNKEPFRSELIHFDRILSGNISELPEDDVESDGYVVHTLEASLWCFLNTQSYKDAVLKAVNLGYDTDTTGCVTGGLAGVHYGIDAIPREWINKIARKEDIEGLFSRYVAKLPAFEV